MQLVDLFCSQVRSWACIQNTSKGKPTSSLGSSDVESGLELSVQDIEKTVGEAPKEEKDCDKSDRQDRLLDSERRGARQAAIGNGLVPRVDFGVRGFPLLVDFLRSGLLTLAKHLVLVAVGAT